MKTFYAFAALCLLVLGGCGEPPKTYVTVTNDSDVKDRWVVGGVPAKVRLRAHLPYKWEVEGKDSAITPGVIEKDPGWVPGDPVYYVFWLEKNSGSVNWKLVDKDGNTIQSFAVTCR